MQHNLNFISLLIKHCFYDLETNLEIGNKRKKIN